LGGGSALDISLSRSDERRRGSPCAPPPLRLGSARPLRGTLALAGRRGSGLKFRWPRRRPPSRGLAAARGHAGRPGPGPGCHRPLALWQAASCHCHWQCRRPGAGGAPACMRPGWSWQGKGDAPSPLPCWMEVLALPSRCHWHCRAAVAACPSSAAGPGPNDAERSGPANAEQPHLRDTTANGPEGSSLSGTIRSPEILAEPW
jgi:hypothetical protein